MINLLASVQKFRRNAGHFGLPRFRSIETAVASVIGRFRAKVEEFLALARGAGLRLASDEAISKGEGPGLGA
jgi:hypothetical protein